MSKILENYFLIDKIIIHINNNFLFNLYSYKNQNDKEQLVVVYDAGTDITQEKFLALSTIENLYVHNQKIQFYDDYIKSYITQKIIPKNMENFYINVSENINKLFEDPESLGNMKEAKTIVSEMVDTILQDDFTVSSFVSILSYDYYTHTHSLNVSIYALCLGKHMGMDQKTLEELGASALLHDLGKSKIDKALINKNGKLTEREFKEVQNHPYLGWLLAKKLGVNNKNILAGIRNHHEKLDGTGYPDGKKADEIHLFAKIVAICDVFDALTTKRSYKAPVSTFDTLIMMKKEMINHLDGKIINHFIQILRDE